MTCYRKDGAVTSGNGRNCPDCGRYTEGAGYCLGNTVRGRSSMQSVEQKTDGEHIHRYCPYCRKEWLDTYPATPYQPPAPSATGDEG